jgi:Rap1a immunity proteins
MKNAVYAISFMILACCHAGAAQMTVGDLLKMCTSDDAGDKVACTFYILGVTEGASLVATSAKGPSGEFREIKDKPFCVPADISSAALELVVRMKIGEDLAVFPKDGDLPAVSFVVAVISKNFPCKKAP